jgi:thiamine transport system substrate-binding protein
MKSGLIAILGLGVFLASCTTSPTVEGPASELRVLTHDSFAVSESIIQSFETEHGVKVSFIKSGDTGSLLNRAILTSASPEADVLYGIDNTYLSRALEAGLFLPYRSIISDRIPQDFILEPDNLVTPIDFGDVCINYDRNYLLSHNLEVPTTLDEFTNIRYRGMLVVENPATSSPGLAFLLTTVANYGESDYLDYWQKLKDNDVVVVNDWSTAYYTNFSGSSGKGLQPFVVSYNTSPAAEVYYAANTITEPPTASITAAQTCYRQIEFAGILKGTRQGELAGKFIDYMLSSAFQEDMPLQMFVFPVNPDAILPDVFNLAIVIPDQPIMLSTMEISDKRDRWIQEWTGVMLR